LCDGALAVLLGRSNTQQALELALYTDQITALRPWLSPWIRRAFDLTRLTGKTLTVRVVQTGGGTHRSDAALGENAVHVAYSATELAPLEAALEIWPSVHGGALSKLLRNLGDVAGGTL